MEKATGHDNWDAGTENSTRKPLCPLTVTAVYPQPNNLNDLRALVLPHCAQCTIGGHLQEGKQSAQHPRLAESQDAVDPRG
eukprot:1196218-Prorocentrum_minimum.AAC.6